MPYYGNVVPPPYQSQTTPFPQGASYGVGAGANTLVSNLIAAALYRKQQEHIAQEQQRQNQTIALARLGILDRFGPGAMRTPGAQGMFQQAGMNIDPAQMPYGKEELEAKWLQDFYAKNPQYAGMPTQVIVQKMKEEAAAKTMEGAARLWGGGQEESMPEYMGIPGSSVGPQGPTSYQPPSRVSEGGQITRSLTAGPEGLSATVKQEPTPVSIQQQRAAAAAFDGFRAQVESELKSGARFNGPGGQPMTLDDMAKYFGVRNTDVIDAIAGTATAKKGHQLPPEAPSLEKLYAQRHKIVTEGNRQQEFKISEQRLGLESKRIEQLIAQGNRAERMHADDLARQYRTEAQKAALSALSQARSHADRLLKLIQEEGGAGAKTPAMQGPDGLLEQYRRATQAITDLVYKANSLVPAGGTPEPPTGFQGTPSAGASAYPSNWFNKNRQPAPIVPSQEPEPEPDLGAE